MCIIYESDRGCYVVMYSQKFDEYYVIVYTDQQKFENFIERTEDRLVGEEELIKVFGHLSLEEISKKLRGNQYLLYNFINVSIW